MRLGIFISAALAAAAPAGAQQAAGGVDFFQSSLSEILDTPLLAASYAEERPSDAAAAAYVVTAETMEKRGYATLLDLLQDMPQFQLQRNSDVRRLNLISVRGIPNNERLVVLYDGARITPPTGDLFAMAGQLSLRNAERVEVVLGPMSSVYGADAFSGVVNVVTRRTGRTAAGLRYGSFRSAAAGATAMSAPGAEVSGVPRAALTYETSSSAGPELPEFFGRDYAWFNGQYRSGLAQKAYYDATTVAVPVSGYDARENSSFLNARLGLGECELGLVKMKESHSSSIGVKPELTLYNKAARFATGTWTVYGRHFYTPPEGGWWLSSTLSYHSYEISPETRFVNSFSGYNDAYKYASAKSASAEETLSFEFAEGFPALLGFSYQENSVLPYTADLGRRFDTDESPLTQGFVYTGSTIPVDFYSLNYSNTGAFLRLQTPEFSDIVLSAGLRYDRNTAYGETWNPRAGLVWKLGGDDMTIVKALYGEAYLAPSPFYAYKHFGAFVSSPTASSGYHSFFFHVPNAKLETEKVRSAEFSVTHKLSHALQLSLNPYYNRVREVIQDVLTGPGTFRGVEVDSIERAENRGTMETYGATLRADASLQALGWSLEPWAAYTYSEGRLVNEPIPFNSRHLIQTGLSAARGHWVLTPKALYRSYTRNQDGGRVPQFTVVDLFVRYAAGRTSGVSAWLDIRNLLDRRYYNAAYGGGPDHLAGAPQEPLSASLGVDYRF